MNQKELIDELITCLIKMQAGKTLETVYPNGNTSKITDVAELISFIESGDEIRIRQIPIPDAPDGEEWLNPDNLTGGQIGIDNGYRLLLKSECENLSKGDLRQGFTSCECWIDEQTQWSGATYYGAAASITYRVVAKKYPVGSLKPEPKPIKCREHSVDGVRLIEPLPWEKMDAMIRPFLNGKVPTCPILDKLKEAGMIAEETD